MKNKTLLLALLCTIVFFGFAIAQDGEPTPVLLVVADDAALNESEEIIIDRFETVFGFAVDIVNQNDADSTWADGMALVYVSSTTTSSTISNKFKNVEVPVIMIEPYALDDMGMSLDNDSTRNYREFFRDILITDESHFLAAGLSGEIVICEDESIQSGQGLPNENGGVIAEFVEWEEGEIVCPGAIFYYEKGAIMADSTEAMERRYFAGWLDLGVANITEQGWQLWDAAINWCLYKDQENAVATQTEPPNEFDLAQNYPNPFNPATTISFSLPTASNIQLVVYDLQGRVVAELENGRLAAGTYNYTFNAENLTSGVYMYTLKTDNSSSTQKMTLLR